MLLLRLAFWFIGVFIVLSFLIYARVVGAGIQNRSPKDTYYSNYLRACDRMGWSKWWLYLAMVFLVGAILCTLVGILK